MRLAAGFEIIRFIGMRTGGIGQGAKGKPESAKPTPAAPSKDRPRMVKIDFLRVSECGVGLSRLLCIIYDMLVRPNLHHREVITLD